MSAKYTLEVLTPAVEQSESIAGVLRILGLKQAGGTQAHIGKRIKDLGIDTTHFTGKGWNAGGVARNRKTVTDILVLLPEGSYRAKRVQLKRAMLAAGFEYKCATCYNDGTWKGKALTLEIDHLNGEWLDNRVENLRFLCPNCHTQTETYGSKSKPT